MLVEHRKAIARAERSADIAVGKQGNLANVDLVAGSQDDLIDRELRQVSQHGLEGRQVAMNISEDR